MHEPIYIAGTGNVGFHLTQRLIEKGFAPEKVFSRTPEQAGFPMQLSAFEEASSLQPGWVFLCVPDRMIAEIATKFPKECLMIHVSGSAHIDVLGAFPRSAVFYPLQSFTRGASASWENIPILVEAKPPAYEADLHQLGLVLSGFSEKVTSEKRRKIHLAATIANNFTNRVITMAYEYAQKEGIDPKWLLPLLEQTIRKIQIMNPEDAQTGPARRGDEKTLNEHLELLQAYPEIREFYTYMSKLLKE